LPVVVLPPLPLATRTLTPSRTSRSTRTPAFLSRASPASRVLSMLLRPLPTEPTSSAACRQRRQVRHIWTNRCLVLSRMPLSRPSLMPLPST
ncbi:hypothetical protein LPJ57_011397, partial [Coemansia sp. RSA 486]